MKTRMFRPLSFALPLVVAAASLNCATFAQAQAAAPAKPEAKAPAKPAPPKPAEIAEKFKDTVDIRFDQPYAGNDNPRQMVDVYLPKKRATDKPLPVVVFIHGGGWINGDRKGYVTQAINLVGSGEYAAVAVGYRMSNEAHWPAQIHDCKAAIRWIRGHAKELNIDPNRIGATGSSAGGHLVSLLGTSGNVKTLDGSIGEFTSLPSNVTCVVNFCGPSNFAYPLYTGPDAETKVDTAVSGLLGGSRQDKPDVAKEASPVTYASKDTPPIMTVHGTKDERVNFEHAKMLDAALQKAGAPTLLIPVEGAGHGIPTGPELRGRIQQFWDLHLRDVKSDIKTTPIAAAPAEPKKP